MDEILVAFNEEAIELLAQMESGLLRIEDGNHDPETINSIFRAAHTIKGDAGIVDLVHVQEFAHALEDTLSLLRSGKITANPPLISVLLRGCDHIKALIADAGSGRESLDPGLQTVGTALVAALGERSGAKQVLTPPTITHTATPAIRPADDPDCTACNDCWHLSVRFGVDVLRNRMDPLDILRYLQTKGQIVRLTTLVDQIPPAPQMNPESCYLGFELYLRSSETRESIERAFEFVRHDCELKILPPGGKLDDYIHSIENLPDEAMKLGEILVKSTALTAAEVDQGLALLRASTSTPPDQSSTPLHLGDILVAQQWVSPEVVAAATVKQEQVAVKKTLEARQIRVQAEKLDQLIDLVGELVISSASAHLKAQKSRQTELVEANSGLVQLVESMRELSMQLRMVRVRDVFNRFKRAARDMAHEMNRDIDLIVRGEDTELDKSVVEKIGDPLLHLLRNAFDHGIEATDVRRARGKPARGTIELNAYHETGGIVIEVSDDGAGLDTKRILAKAIERGLVDAGQSLSEAEIIDLIFLPGFSTADTVTSISGRGVGMDVVRSNITALRGTIEVKTELGRGSTFIFRLPLTMAIIDGFLVGIGQACYVIPLDTVVECLQLENGDDEPNYLNLRGQVLPLLRLRERFGERSARPERENVVVVRAGMNRAGIVVDLLHGELQTVIKPMPSLFQNLPGIAGSTILGTGAVALILDVPTLLAKRPEKT